MDYNWIVKEDNLIKNIPLTDLPPTINSSIRCKSEASESTLKEPEKPKISINASFSKKLPISFISPKDWQKYLNYTNSLSNITSKKSSMTQRRKSGRIVRLLNSFHILYEEYSSIFDYLSGKEVIRNSGDDNTFFRHCTNDATPQFSSIRSQCETQADSYDLSNGRFTDISVQTVMTMKQAKLTFCKRSEKISSFSWSVRNIINPARKLSDRLKQISQNVDDKKKPKVFDSIVKFESNVMIDVTEEVRQKSVICHDLHLVNINLKKLNLPKMKLLQIPLAIELLLPKIQAKIENILNDCPFLCDPLEVAAELRHFGYDQAACIKYFKITKGLRSIIEEILPTSNININNSIHNIPQLHTRSPSSLSLNSRIALNEINERSNEVIKSSDSNANHCVEDSVKQAIFIDGFRSLSNELSDSHLSPAVRPNHSIKFNSVTIDCITQTNSVNFLMNDKNMESIFYKIKHYLTIIRQLHSETRDEIEYLRKQLCCVFSSLKSHIGLLINQNSEKSFSDEQKIKMVTLSRQVEELKLKLKKEEKKRRNAYNLMQEQMGNIRVYCRCRHVVDGGSILEFIGNETISLSIAPNERFEFDKVFPPSMSQYDLYEEFRPLVMSFIDGYNVCFITYGGEASGKTFTLIGGNDGSNQQGLMQRALTTILMEERLRQRDCEYKITACVVEIYNDNCIDVLSGETNIQLYVDNGMETAYHKLKSVPITNEADAEALMQVCRVKRKVAKTALNPASSRSHLITLIRLQGRSKIHGENICSFLCLCDLAGFEDIIKAETQTNKILSKEAGYINRSLTAFNRVFVSLRKQDPNTVSYRDTKLTHLLKPFLTNSGKCALIITVRNDKRSLGSTQNTLRFGRETRGVLLGKARRQVNLNAQVSVL